MQHDSENSPDFDNMQYLLPTSPTELCSSLEEYADVASWINDLLDRPESDQPSEAEAQHADLSELDKRVSQLSATLEVACEDTSAQVERTIDEISRTVPRLTYDLQFMRESALSLQVALHTVESRTGLSVISGETAQALESLHFLDTVKRNMDASLVVLREAEAWSSLESEVVGFLAEKAYNRAASRLSEASRSLTLFQNTPEYDIRRTLMVNLQNQLEASLSSALVAGITSRDDDACKSFFEIFCNIEREAEFRGYWNGIKRKSVVELWEGAFFRDCEEESTREREDNSALKFAVFLSDFYREILALIQVERHSVVSIFPDPQPTLSSFINLTLASLHPSLAQRLNSLAVHYGDLALPELITTFKATEEFAVATDKIMEKVGYSAGFISPIASPSEERESVSQFQKSHQMMRSSRMSMSRRLVHRRSSKSGPIFLSGSSGNRPALDNSWDDSLFESFIDYQSDYSSLEKRFLNEQLRRLLFGGASSSDGARMFRERSVDVLSMAEESLVRCVAFTHGYGAVGLVEALDNVFEVFLDSSRKELIARTSLSSQSITAANGMSGIGEDFAELDYSADDYASFQLALHLLEAARGLLDRVAIFETKLRANLLQTSGALRMMRNDPSSLYISGTTRGAVGLLQGSTLNSAELYRLLNSVDPDPQQSPGQALLTPALAGTGGQKQASLTAFHPLLLGARGAISNFAKACQTFLQETILTPLLKHLATYPSSASWTVPGNPKAKRSGGAGGGGVSEVVIPTFSLSPSQTIQRVAEGLLNLPRLFEVYADDDALAFSIETLPFVNSDSLKTAVTESTMSPGGAEQGKSKENAAIDNISQSRRLSSPSISLKILPPPPLQSVVLTPDIVSSAWLTSLALSLLSHLTSKVLPSIPALSPGGAAQLAEDLEYLSQIVRALNVEWEELEQWKEVIYLEEHEMEQRLSKGKDQGDSAELDVVRIVARLRGWYGN